jgi:hypothetical protein
VRSKIDQKSKPHRRKLHFSPGGLANRSTSHLAWGESKGVSQQILTEDPILASDWTFGAGNGGQVDCRESRPRTLSGEKKLKNRSLFSR